MLVKTFLSYEGKVAFMPITLEFELQKRLFAKKINMLLIWEHVDVFWVGSGSIRYKSFMSRITKQIKERR